MYGLVNRAIEFMVCDFYDEETWERIKLKAGMKDVDFFISMNAYPDDITHRLVAAAAEVLNLPPAEILAAFGEYWITYTAEQGYGELMNISGDTLPEFLQNLDNLHTRVGLTFSQLKPPSFEAEKTSADTMNLHYKSSRKGLSPMIKGLMHGLGKRFLCKVEVEHISHQDNGKTHDIFSIKYNRLDSNDDQS